MGFYSKLSVETSKFTEFLNRANEGDLGIGLMYGIEKSKFMMHASASLKDNRNVTKVMEGCIQNELWGFFTFLITQYSSYSGVKKIILKNYELIPKEFRASIFSVLCYGQKWSDEDLNDVFVDLIADQDEKENNLSVINDEDDEFEVYYPLGWGETIYSAVNSPCWFYSELDAEAYCLYSKLFYVKNAKIPELKEYLNDFYMFGEGELHSIETIKTRVLKGKIRKKDVLAVINPEELFNEFLPQTNIIQNQSVYDIEEMENSDVEEGETDSLANLIAIYNDSIDSDELVDLTWEVYDLIIKNCEKYGMPELVKTSTVQNREMVLPKDVALLIRTRLRTTQGNAIKVAKVLCKTEKNAKWIFSSSQGYRAKRNYFYRGLGYSSYTNKIFSVAFQYVSENKINVISTKETMEECKDFLDIFAIDYESESKTLEGLLEKCNLIANPEIKKENQIEIRHVKEKLTEEEKETIKKQYREAVDDEYRREIQTHKDNAEFKANEAESLKIKYEKVLRENEELKRQLAKKQALLDKQSEISILSLGSEKEKYEGETHAMILSSIRHELKNCDPDSRRHDVLESVLDKNTDEHDPISEKLSEIKKITKGYRNASEMKQELINQGFQYTEDGRHPKIQYPGDDRYIITAASTTSDVRAGENLYALIKKKFF